MPFCNFLSKSGSTLTRYALPFNKIAWHAATRGYVTLTPPTVRVSFMEKMAIGLLLSASFLATPAWVLYHVPEYQGEKREDFKK